MRELFWIEWDAEGRLHLGFIPSMVAVATFIAVGVIAARHDVGEQLVAETARADQAEHDLRLVRSLVRSGATCGMVPADPVHVDLDGAP